MPAEIRGDNAESAARSLLPRNAYDYAAGGAGDESTVERNIRRLDAFCPVPRVMRDVSAVDTSAAVVGGTINAPVLVAPMGLQRFYHEEAECAVAAAAADLGLGFCLSTFANCSPVQVAKAAGSGLRWRQQYVMRDRGLTTTMIHAAEDAGFDALVCTLDVPVVGSRNRDAANSLRRFDAEPPAVAYEPYFEEMLDRRPSATRQELIDEVFPHPGCSWADLEDLVATTRLPVLVKGVLHPDDATRAVAAGAAGIVVSNHGGRQFDRCVAAIDALPRVADAVGDDLPVYFDSGIRRGSHIAAALARGAHAVLVGRPVLWGLAAGGRDGARSVLAELITDLRGVMGVTGCPTVADLRRLSVVDEGGTW